jgi:TIR domain
MPNQTTNVFVSYSHTDASLVAPVVKLLRANKSLVFQDIDSIQPGKKWRSEIAKGLAESDLVVVFWCDHASRSDEVCEEWRTAIEQEKDVLPLLLDATPLPRSWVTFSGSIFEPRSARTTPRSFRRHTTLR